MDNTIYSGIYIHIPFCRSKCPYCGFYSVSMPDLMYAYHEYLLYEIEMVSEKFSQIYPPVETIYLGGGTPSILPIHAVDELLTRIRTTYPPGTSWKELEITLEANPEDLEIGYLKAIRSIGVNRLSIGAQRLDKSKLEFLGRSHDPENLAEGIRNARNAGFDNVNLDMIIGLPDDNPSMIKKEIESFAQCEVNHLSVYMLEIKDNTPFADFRTDIFPDEDMIADLYMAVIEETSKIGLEQYEISNFSQNGFESRHNMKYWKGEPWLGLGASAASYSGSSRWSNPPTIEGHFKYLSSSEFKIPPDNAITDIRTLAEEQFFMAMRMTGGVNIKVFNDKWGIDILEGREDFIRELVSNNLAKMENNRFYLTIRGFLISNEILSRFLS